MLEITNTVHYVQTCPMSTQVLTAEHSGTLTTCKLFLKINDEPKGGLDYIWLLYF